MYLLPITYKIAIWYILKYFFISFYLYEYFACFSVCLCTMCALYDDGNQKTTSDFGTEHIDGC